MIRTDALANILLFIFLLFITNSNCSNLIKNSSNNSHQDKINFKIIQKDSKKISKKKVNLYSHLFFVLTNKCNEKICVSETSNCLNENVCKCKKGYANVPLFSSKKSQFCQYKQKKHYIALFLEIISFCGLGHIYAHRIIMFYLKFLFFAITLLLSKNHSLYQNEKSSKSKLISQLAYYSILSMFILYHILDIMMFYLNKYTDGYGVPLTFHS